MQWKFAGYDGQKLYEIVIQENKTIDRLLKFVSEKLYVPEELKPLCEATVPKKVQSKESKDKGNEPRFYVRIGKSAALDHSDFKKKFSNSKLKSTFTTHLETFYNEKFRNNERPYIEKAVKDPETVHILLTG